MSEFNMSAWMKNQYLNEAGLGSSKSQSLAKSINDAMVEIDDSMSYRDFAVAVAILLKEEYGSHNFTPFMEVLHAELGMKESLNEYFEYGDLEKKLADELENGFQGNPYVTMGKYAGDEEKGFGNITFRIKDEFPDSTWGEILNFIKSKGFNITQESNYYDIEPGEREWFPSIKFDFNTKSI